MTKPVLQHVRHFAIEHVTWLSVCGLIAVVTGFTPEEWIGYLAEKLRASDLVYGHWPGYLDLRAVLVAVGVGIIVTDVLLKRRLPSRSAVVAQSPSGQSWNTQTQLRACREILHRFRLTKLHLLNPDPMSTPNASRILPLTVALDPGCAYGTNLLPEFENMTVRQILAQSVGQSSEVLQPLETIVDRLEEVNTRWRQMYDQPAGQDLVKEMIALVADAEGRLTRPST